MSYRDHNSPEFIIEQLKSKIDSLEKELSIIKEKESYILGSFTDTITGIKILNENTIRINTDITFERYFCDIRSSDGTIELGKRFGVGTAITVTISGKKS